MMIKFGQSGWRKEGKIIERENLQVNTACKLRVESGEGK